MSDFTVKGVVTIDTTQAQQALQQLNTAQGNTANTSQQTTASITASNTQIAASYQTMGAMVTGMSTLAMMSIQRLQSSETSLTMAQNNVTISQAQMILTLREYGANSVQAIKAHEQLSNAMLSESNAQRSLNMQWIQMVATVIPSFISAIPTIVANIMRITGATEMQTAAVTAQIAAYAALIGVATMGIGLVAAGIGMATFNQSTSTTNNNMGIFYNYGQVPPSQLMQQQQQAFNFSGQTIP